MITLRLDVDYPYPSRLQSFIFTVLNRKVSKNYLKNAKIIAKMINSSSKDVRAYWFFTPQTIPDKEMLMLLRQDKHDIGLHIINCPQQELEHLQRATNRAISFYTVHGTSRLLAKLMWRRKIYQDKIKPPQNFALKSFYVFPSFSIDCLVYNTNIKDAIEITTNKIAEGRVLHMHPEWLIKRGVFNHRGPYIEVLKNVLNITSMLSRQYICGICKKPNVNVTYNHELKEHICADCDLDFSKCVEIK
jgi:hypothetical protein